MLLPDLGSAMVILVATAGLLVFAGTSGRWLAALGIGSAVAAVAATQLHLLAQHQVNRFAAFADPHLDPQGVGYNTAQARLAIGSGGVLGKGLFNGTQTNGRYVPEQQTDFVFTVAGEELGFVGGVVLIALFAVLLLRGIAIARQCRGPVRDAGLRRRGQLVRLRDLREHRHDAGHHAGRGHPAAVRLLRRLVDVRQLHRRRPGGERAAAAPPRPAITVE